MSKRLATLCDIAALLAPKAAKRIAKAVTFAYESPDEYVAKNGKRFEIDETFPDLAWYVLRRELEREKRCFHIDWKTDAENVEWAIGKKIRGVPRGSFAWMKKDKELEDRATWELLELSGKHLEERGFALADFVTGGDDYALTVVPKSQVKKLLRLGKAARYPVSIFGDDLEAATKDRIEREKKHQREQAREAKRKPPKIDHYGRGQASWWMRCAPLAVDTGFYDPKKQIKFYAFHYFPKRPATKTGARRIRKEWVSAGFRKLTQKEADKLPEAADAYIGWQGPFPEDARYFLETAKLVCAYALRGDTVWSTRCSIGHGFAELQSIQHFSSEKRALADFNERVQSRVSAKWREVTPEKLAVLYKQRKRAAA